MDALGESEEAAEGRALHSAYRVGFTIRGPIERADLPGLCDRLVRLLRLTGATGVECAPDHLVHPDAVAVDAVARLQLTAQQCAAHLRLRGASADLRELLAFVALDIVTDAEATVE
ncbi:MAG: hypothetical protein QOJ49_1182 [Actinomycetota bacterium]|nr:hypothetical protein [Actinomycetota bacterium]